MLSTFRIFRTRYFNCFYSTPSIFLTQLPTDRLQHIRTALNQVRGVVTANKLSKASTVNKVVLTTVTLIESINSCFIINSPHLLITHTSPVALPVSLQCE